MIPITQRAVELLRNELPADVLADLQREVTADHIDTNLNGCNCAHRKGPHTSGQE